MATTTTCAHCKCETHFTRMSMLDYVLICIPCWEKEDEEKDTKNVRKMRKKTQTLRIPKR